MENLVRQYYTRDAYYYIHTDPWYTTRWRLDLAGSLSIWLGALLYNVSCFSGAYRTRWRLDLAGSLSICYGALLYNISCFCGAYRATFRHYPRICNSQETCGELLAEWPDIIGGVLFVLGGYFFWWAQHQTPSLVVKKPFSMEWFLTFFNLLGALGFYYGAASTAPLAKVPGLVGNWVQLLIGYVFGSFFFLLGSYLMIAEVATSGV